MSSNRSRARTLGGHLATGFVTGTIFGLTYFLAEPVRLFKGHFYYLDLPLPVILDHYLLAGAAIGIVFGVIAGLGALTGPWRRRSRPNTAVYASVFASLLAVVLWTRTYTVNRLRTLSWGDVGLLAIVVVALLLAGLVVGRFVGRRVRPPAGARPALVALCVAAIVVSTLVAKRSTSDLPRHDNAGDAGSNVVLIVLDALRSDHTSAYGYERDTTPTMKRLADEGVLFRRAQSHGNRTILAMPAVFTSLYPSFHGAINRKELKRPLRQSHTTIAEIFRARGYTTVGLMTNIYLKRVFGMTQGFDRVEEFNRGRFELGLYKAARLAGLIDKPVYVTSGTASAEEVSDRAIHWLRAAGDRPVFLFIHYMDTHHPYLPGEGYATMFGDGTTDPSPRELYRETHRLIETPMPRHLDPAALSKLEDYYDGCIRYTDDQIGRVIGEVRRIAKKRDTIVVITADHGDEFLEHHSLYHTNLVYQELIRVPLIVWDSRQTGRARESDTLVRHVDILPTLAELIGADTPAGIMGRSLVSVIRGDEVDDDVTSIAEGDFCSAIVRDGWKLMKVDSTGVYHLFDLSTDPGETTDLAGTEPAVLNEMTNALEKYLEQAKMIAQEQEAQMDEETIRQLKALGYL